VCSTTIQKQKAFKLSSETVLEIGFVCSTTIVCISQTAHPPPPLSTRALLRVSWPVGPHTHARAPELVHQVHTIFIGCQGTEPLGFPPRVTGPRGPDLRVLPLSSRHSSSASGNLSHSTVGPSISWCLFRWHIVALTTRLKRRWERWESTIRAGEEDWILHSCHRPLNIAGLRWLLRHVELPPRRIRRRWERWESPINAEGSVELLSRLVKHWCCVVTR
jgi:hypothetical protein